MCIGKLAVIKVGEKIPVRKPAPQVSTDLQSPKTGERKVHLVQDLFEKGLGVVMAAMRIPSNLASGILVGGAQGLRKGSGLTEEISPKSTAISQVCLNTLWSQAYAAATGFLVGGPIGAAASSISDAIGSGTGIYLFIKSGAAKEVGQRMADELGAAVSRKDGPILGLGKGMQAGAWSSLKAAAVTGWREGKGTGAGIVAGTKSALKHLKLTRLPKDGWLGSTLKSAFGLAAAALALPVGAAAALATSAEQREEVGLVKRLAIAGGTGAALGAAVGFLGGPVGLAVGAAIGAGINLLGPSSGKKLFDRVGQAVRLSENRKEELGSEVANNNRALFSKGIVGAAAAGAQAWNTILRGDK